MQAQNVLIAGEWRPSRAAGTFQAENPAAKQLLPDVYPVSAWADVDGALHAATAAATALRSAPGEQVAAFLEKFADKIESQRDALVADRKSVV